MTTLNGGSASREESAAVLANWSFDRHGRPAAVLRFASALCAGCRSTPTLNDSFRASSSTKRKTAPAAERPTDCSSRVVENRQLAAALFIPYFDA